MKIINHTNAEDIKRKSFVDRFVDQLIRQTVKSNMTSEFHASAIWALKQKHRPSFIENFSEGLINCIKLKGLNCLELSQILLMCDKTIDWN